MRQRSPYAKADSLYTKTNTQNYPEVPPFQTFAQVKYGDLTVPEGKLLSKPIDRDLLSSAGSALKLDLLIKQIFVQICQKSQLLNSTMLALENEMHFGPEAQDNTRFGIPSTKQNSNPVASQMLYKFVFAWNEIANSYRISGFYAEAMETYAIAIDYYSKLDMKKHAAFASADYYLT